MPPALRTSLSLLAAIAIFALTAEGVARAWNPPPRTQVVDLYRQDLRWMAGRPVWREAEWEIPVPIPCPAPDGLNVLVMGDSIAVSGALPPQSIGPRLAHRLQQTLDRPVCAKVAGVPGLPVESQFAFAKHLDPHGDADAWVLLLWRSSGDAVRAGRWWIETTQIEVDDDGWPHPPVPVPDGWHRTLLAHSTLWRYATLAVARPTSPDPDRALRTHREVFQWAETHDIPVLLAEMPPLHQDLGLDWDRPVWLEQLKRSWTERGKPFIDVGAALAARGEQVEEVRIDTCCHYQPYGHDAVAAVLTSPVQALLPPPPTDDP